MIRNVSIKISILFTERLSVKTKSSVWPFDMWDLKLAETKDIGSLLPKVLMDSKHECFYLLKSAV